MMFRKLIPPGCLLLALGGCAAPPQITSSRLLDRPARLPSAVEQWDTAMQVLQSPAETEAAKSESEIARVSAVQTAQAAAAGTQVVAASAQVGPQQPSVPAAPSTEASGRELQPGVGEIYTPPPAIPPTPPGLHALEEAGQTAPVTAPLTLENLETLACQFNPTLVQAEANVQGAVGQAVQAGLWPNPVVFFRNVLPGVSGPKDPNTAGGFLGGTAQQLIVTADKLDIQRAQFLQRSTSEQWRALAQQWRVLNDVRIHYFRTLGQQATVNVRKELLQTAEDNVVTSREAYNIGVVGREQLHLANIQLQQQRLELLQNENLLRGELQRLMTITGTDTPFTSVEGDLEQGLPLIDWDIALQRILEESPQLIIATSNLRADEILLKRQIVDVVPNVAVQGGAGLFDPGKDEAVNFTAITTTVPVWDWNQGNIRTAEADVVRQRSEVRRTQLQLESELSVVYQDYLTNLQHAKNFQDVILPESRRRYEVLLDAYEDDRAQYLRVLEAQRAYYLSRLQYIDHLVQWRTNEVLIVGYLLSGGLAPVPNPFGPGFTPPLNPISLMPGD